MKKPEGVQIALYDGKAVFQTAQSREWLVEGFLGDAHSGLSLCSMPILGRMSVSDSFKAPFGFGGGFNHVEARTHRASWCLVSSFVGESLVLVPQSLRLTMEFERWRLCQCKA